MRKAVLALFFTASLVWAGPSMDGSTNHVVRNVDNSGGENATSPSGRMVGSVGEEVVVTTTTSGSNVIRAGFSELHAFPRAVTDLGAQGVGIKKVTLQWTTPGYDGHDGTLQVGSTYFIRVSSYNVPDTFSDHRLANLSFSTSGVLPGEVVGVSLIGLKPSATYWARVWTTDGDSDLSYGSNISTFVMLPDPSPPVPSGDVVFAGSVTVAAAWSSSLGATSYMLIASTSPLLEPVYASSITARTTGTVSGLDPNTSYYLAISACNAFCSDFAPVGSTMTMAAPALSLAPTDVSSTTISLAWDANGNPPGTRFFVKSSTDGAVFATAAITTAPAAALSGLQNRTSYYLKVVAVNDAGTAALASNLVTVWTVIGPPHAPSSVAASAVMLGVKVTWDALPPSAAGAGLLDYRVARSTSPGFGFVTAATTTATSYLDRPLALGATYYYKVLGRDIALAEGPYSPASGAFPFTTPPMEPLGVKVVPAPLSVAFSWSTTTRHGDGTPFLSTSTPIADELIGYAVYRSTEPCAPSFTNLSSVPYATTGLVDVTGGANYYYRVHSYNSVGLSTSAVTFSSLGERSFFLDDCVTRVVLDAATAEGLNADVNGAGDIRIEHDRMRADEHDGVFRSVAFKAMRDGVTEIPNFALPKAVSIVLGFQTQGGSPVTPSAAPAAGLSVKNLGLFWYNGAEFKKVYGVVDPLSQTVSVQSPNLGAYQIRALARVEGTVFDLSNISGRAITPNGDGLNDVVIFTYDPGPGNEAVTGQVFDITGARVADMTAGRVPNTLIWNGRSNGRTVGGGAYVYRVQGGGKTFTGTIVVAR